MIYEAYISGIDREGKKYPRQHMASSICVQHLVDEYLERFPTCVRLIIDVALPVHQKVN